MESLPRSLFSKGALEGAKELCHRSIRMGGGRKRKNSFKNLHFPPLPELADFTNMAAMPQQIISNNELVNFL